MKLRTMRGAGIGHAPPIRFVERTPWSARGSGPNNNGQRPPTTMPTIHRQMVWYIDLAKPEDRQSFHHLVTCGAVLGCFWSQTLLCLPSHEPNTTKTNPNYRRTPRCSVNEPVPGLLFLFLLRICGSASFWIYHH